ncbi:MULTISPECIES: signal peptidase I [unclassified Actinomyces]|uniref:signal peptidase I n=1 Tax=Actinomyces sp. AC-20-1 TaxID=2761167 RepID=UPI0020195883|nr:signal peptidase I [Actinomyces sp. 217892]
MSARSTQEPEGRGEQERASRHPVLSVIGLPVLALAVIILVRSLVLQTFVIPSGSMEDTLVDGDRVAVTMYDADDLERGDVVVFRDPGGWLTVTEPTGLRGAVQDLLVALRILPEDPGHHLIKRVIGLPGDRVVADGSGTVSVNGVVLDEGYVKEGRSGSDVAFDVVVPEGFIWVMGDNRSNSADSRYHQDDAHGGFVPMSEVVGVAKAVVWPLDRLGTLSGGHEPFSAVPEP